MYNSIPSVPLPKNEPVLSYAPGSGEKRSLKKMLEEFSKSQVEIPLIIGGKEVRTGNMGDCAVPHNHSRLIGRYHKADSQHVGMAVSAAASAKGEWENMPWGARAAIFLRAADLLAGEYRDVLNAATMLSQSKTVHQAEIDSACELIDFFRFNAYFMSQLYAHQPESSAGVWNQIEYRPLEGFVLAITPFNFTSIAGNLPASTAMMGNTVVWKPASSAVYSAHYIMRLLQKAGLPDGVINLVPGAGRDVGEAALAQRDLAGVHFTGSTTVFHNIWRTIGGNIDRYRSYPRIVGETGGKGFVFVHSSACPREAAVALVRGAFEYQGQKCSSASRAYIPDGLWGEIRRIMCGELEDVKTGDVADFTNFMGAVIDKGAFDKIAGYIEFAKKSKETEIVFGGGCDDSKGYFISPTVILTESPRCKLMEEEIFGPVLTVYVYPDNAYSETLELCDGTSEYGLTGAIFAHDRNAINEALLKLRHSAGNFYINDKPTGAVVGGQPFGGARASGTNDKAGSQLNLPRWVSARAIKETFCPPRAFRYPFMEEK